MIRRPLLLLAYLASSAAAFSAPLGAEIIVSVKNQTMTLFAAGQCKAQFPVSTSKFGIGNTPGSYRTPLGIFRVESKVGSNAKSGSVFKGLRFTGEILSPNAPGRDPIVTRVLCLRGVESANSNARRRGIFIHGTPEENRIGKPASYGCIRMKSSDIIQLYEVLPVGSRVIITDAAQPTLANPGVSDGDEDWFR